MNEPKIIALPRARAPKALDERSDDELMALASGGERAAFAALAARYADRLVQFCAKWVGDPVLGEEIAQETWLCVWAGRGAYVPCGKFPVYLYTVARNRCRNHRRDGRRRARVLRPEAEAPEPAADEPDRLEALLAHERRRRLHEALSGLPEAHREAVLLRYGEGLAYDAIAAVVGASESTLRSRVFHALKGLRRALTGGRS
jgi:RNA polymerase sigma-70 factor (ECF subfamily)